MRGGRGNCELRIASALWGQRDYKFRRAFTSLVEKQYGGKLQEMDFITMADNAARRSTPGGEADRRQDQEPHRAGRAGRRDPTGADQRDLLQGSWARKFKPEQTRAEPFTLLGGSSVQVSMMIQESRFGYAETDKLQVLEMHRTRAKNSPWSSCCPAKASTSSKRT